MDLGKGTAAREARARWHERQDTGVAVREAGYGRGGGRAGLGVKVEDEYDVWVPHRKGKG